MWLWAQGRCWTGLEPGSKQGVEEICGSKAPGESETGLHAGHVFEFVMAPQLSPHISGALWQNGCTCCSQCAPDAAPGSPGRDVAGEGGGSRSWLPNSEYQASCCAAVLQVIKHGFGALEPELSYRFEGRGLRL